MVFSFVQTSKYIGALGASNTIIEVFTHYFLDYFQQLTQIAEIWKSVCLWQCCLASIPLQIALQTEGIMFPPTTHYVNTSSAVV